MRILSHAFAAAAALIIALPACGGDDSGTSDTASDTTTTTTGDDAAPVVMIARPTQGALVPAGQPLLFTGNVSDDHDPSDAIAITWSSDRVTQPLFEGFPSATGNTTFETDALAEGEHLITLTAVDTAGRTASANVVITVNEGPGAPELAIAPAAPTTDDDLVAAITRDAPDPNRAASELTYRYR